MTKTQESSFNNETDFENKFNEAIIPNTISNSVNISYNKKTKFHEITLGGMKFLSSEENYFLIPVTLLEGKNISLFPTSVTIVPYLYVLGNEVLYLERKLEIMNNGQGTATII